MVSPGTIRLTKDGFELVRLYVAVGFLTTPLSQFSSKVYTSKPGISASDKSWSTYTSQRAVGTLRGALRV